MIVPPVSPSSLLRYDSVVRLTQFFPVGDSPSYPEAFTAAWKGEFGTSSPDGVLYRELCRQVPEWSALAKREIDNPIEAAYIEYTIVEPWVDLSTLPALPVTQGASYSVVQDMHSAAFHFAKKSRQEAPGTLMFNFLRSTAPPEWSRGF